MLDCYVFEMPTRPPSLGWLESRPGPAGSSTFLVTTTQSGADLLKATTRTNTTDAINDFAASLGGSVKIQKYPLEPGQYHSRIFRGPPHVGTDVDEKAFLSANASARLLYEALESILSTVEPSGSMANVYGHRMGHSLILACTEVEAAWGGVLKANGYLPGRWSTNDYVKLLRPMRLNEWRVRLGAHPDYPDLLPFEGWDPAKIGTSGFKPTES